MLDVVIFCEGTYPYVSGGVSSWIHSLVTGMPELKFGLVFLAPSRNFQRKLKFKLPDSVTEMVEVYIYDVVSVPQKTEGNKAAAWEAASRFFNGIMDGRLPDFDEIFKYLVPTEKRRATLSVEELAFSRKSWNILVDLYQRRAPDFPFTDFFWNWRFICFPLIQLLHAPIPPARVYHTVTTGWSGFLGVLAKMKTGRPLLLTEHGIYTNERRIEIVKADWIYVEQSKSREAADFGILKSVWINLFNALGRLCYDWSDQIFTLFEGNRRLQISHGAPPDRLEVLPNGVRLDLFVPPAIPPPREHAFVIGFVGRIVPIKDVKTFIQACRIVMQEIPDSVAWLIGPTEEDQEYFEECQSLTETLGLKERVLFLGPQNVREFYPKLDVMVLTSVSEGQPLVILECYCYGVPCVSTDVGACSELIYGREGDDRQLGQAGFVTRVGSPSETAQALIELAKAPELRKQQGDSGKARVKKFYNFDDLLQRYRDIYRDYGSRPTMEKIQPFPTAIASGKTSKASGRTGSGKVAP